MGRILTRLTRAAAVASGDAQLLDAFLSGRDDQAFRGLVERHGSMVFAVCMRVLRHRQDAEDAFQATFLVLARRAGDVWPRSAVGSWLYGVAYRVALKCRTVRARRLGREQPLGETDREAASESAPSDLAEAIGRAIHKLPEVYRSAVVACDLEGRSRREAAEQLGWKEGTLSGRLARARQILADRLRRSGLTLPAGGVAAVMGREAAPAVGSEVIDNTVRVATGTLAAGVSAPVAALTEGVVQNMFLAKLKTAAVAVLASCAIGFGVWTSAGAGDGPGIGPGDTHGARSGDGPLPTAAAGQKPVAKAKDDLDLMQGTWHIVSHTERGKKVISQTPGEGVVTGVMTAVITGRTITFPEFSRNSKGKQMEATFTLDPTGSPKHIDLVADGRTVLGIYEFSPPRPGSVDRKLRIAFVAPHLPRPTEFDSPAVRSQGGEFVLARVRPEGTALGPDRASDEKPAAKWHPDLEMMQGQWWILATGEGGVLKHTDPNTAQDPRALSIGIRDDRLYGWILISPLKGLVGDTHIVLDPTKTPKQIDLVHEGGRMLGVYEFVPPGPKDDVIQLRLLFAPGGTRPLHPLTGPPRPVGTVAVILGRYVDPKKDPSTNAGIGPRRGEVPLDLTAADGRLQIAHIELERALKAIKDRPRPKNPDDFVTQMHQDKARLDAAVQLIEQAELEVLKARLKAKPAPKLPGAADPGARDPIDDARLRAEIERQRDRAETAAIEAVRTRAELEAAKKRAELAEMKLAEMVKQLQAELAAARAAEQTARDIAEQSQAAERAAREALEKIQPRGKNADPPVQTVAVANENGKYLSIPEALQLKIEEKVIAAFLNSGGELVPVRGGPPFANADRWTRAEKGAHVKVHFPQKRMWSGNSPAGKAGVSDILIPMTDRQAPEYLLIHDGDTYRAFFNLPEATVKELQQLLAELKK